MKRVFYVVSLLILFTAFNVKCYAKINDAFVLVDVSGTMNNKSINSEAKTIILNYLTGNKSLDSWEDVGWKKEIWDNSIPGSFIKTGSKVCIIPFGNINRVNDRKKITVDGINDFSSWFNSYYPTKFRDEFTYLTLAKAYVGSVCLTENIKKAYVLIYTDGIPESEKKQYNSVDQRRVDEFMKANAMDKLGILRKEVENRKHYDIEIWEFTMNGKIKTNERGDTDSVIVDPPHPKLKITYPTNEGLNEKHSLSVKQEEQFRIKWNECGAGVTVFQKNDGGWKRINGKKARNYFVITKHSNSANITFLESGDYKIVVRGNNGSDERYVSVSVGIGKALIPILLVVLAVIGGVLIYQKLIKKDDHHIEDFGSNKRPKDSKMTNDNW